MKNYYRVTFQYSENTYCTNIAHAADIETVNAHYNAKYAWSAARIADDYDIETARRKGMPFIEL